jgi:hypothetical protein
MDVVGHDDEITQEVALTVEKFEGIDKKAGHVGLLEKGLSKSFIHQVFESLSKGTTVFVPIIGGEGLEPVRIRGVNVSLGQPHATAFIPFVDYRARQGVGEAESDEMSGPGLAPMGKVGVRFGDS